MITPACPKFSIKYLSAFVLTVSLFVVASRLTVFAQNASTQLTQSTQPLDKASITAIPPRLGDDFSLKVKPGEKIQTSVRVRNSSPRALTLKSAAQDFIVGENGETPVPIDDVQVSNRWSLASWIILTPDVNELAPNQITTVNVIIDVPSDALPGGHYAMITHQPTTNDNAEFVVETPASASFLQQRVGTLVYVMVEGPINESAFIRKLTIPRFTEYGPVPFSFEVDNQSDIHIHPQIGVEIYNIFGKKVETIPIEGKNVFPFMPRTFTGQWDRVWGFGPYRAKVVMSYGSGGQVAMAQTGFWLLPITLIIAALVVLLTLLAIYIVIRRHIKHRQQNQRTQIDQLEAKVRELERKKLDQFDT